VSVLREIWNKSLKRSMGVEWKFNCKDGKKAGKTSDSISVGKGSTWYVGG